MTDGDAATDGRLETWHPRWRDAFAALNYAWIEQFFEVEDLDRQYLDSPEAMIIDRGGEIFFVLEDDVVAGTCAMTPTGQPDEFELQKMAVDPAFQGRGYSNLLMEGAIDYARAAGAARVVIVSNTILTPAIALYRKYGFVTVREGQTDSYDRGNIEMVLEL